MRPVLMLPATWNGTETWPGMTFELRGRDELLHWPCTNCGGGSGTGTTIVNQVTVTGITNLNAQTNASQTFSTGTSGSDFNIASSGGNHAFNLPTASAGNRGALSSADWSTFNAKASVAYVDTTSSNRVTVAPGANVTVTTNGSGGVMTYTVAASGVGEANVNGEKAVTNATRFGWVWGKEGISNLLRSLEVGWGLSGTNQGTNLVAAVDAAVIPSHTQLNTASNAVVTLTSNNVRVAAGANILVASSGSGGVQTYTVTGTSNRVGVYRTISIPAWSIATNATGGAVMKTEETATNLKNRDYLEFSDSVTNVASINFPMPELWDRGTVEVKFHWGSTNGAADQTNVWAVATDTADDGDALDGAYGTEIVVRDKVADANDLLITAASGAITAGNAAGAASALIDLRFRRLPAHADDTLGGVAKLYAVVLRYLETGTEPTASW